MLDCKPTGRAAADTDTGQEAGGRRAMVKKTIKLEVTVEFDETVTNEGTVAGDLAMVLWNHADDELADDKVRVLFTREV